MTRLFRRLYAIAIVGIPLVLAQPAAAQDEFEVWFGGEGLWTNDDNWSFGGSVSGAPSLDAERGAQINGGTVIVDEDVDTGGLLLTSGTIDIQNGSLLSDKTDLQSGVTDLNGTVRVAAGTSFTGPDVDVRSNGRIELLAPTSGFEAKGDLSLRGSLQLGITADGVPNIKVGGNASISGVISPVFEGLAPKFGDSFSFLSGAQSVAADNAVVQLPSTVSLGRGLEARVEFDSSSASLAIGNVPVVQLDRVAGTTKLLNVVGNDLAITGYTIGSESGLLDNSAFTPSGADGFIAPNPLATSLSEISLQNELTLNVGAEVNLGKAYKGGAVHPDDEDVSFTYTTPAGRVLNGLVEYVGPANDFVANVNPETGEVTLYHLSSHIDPVEITGYTIASPGGSLDPAAFNGIGEDGWGSANPQSDRISELNLASSKVFENGTVVPLGNIFKSNGARDIEVQYSTASHLLLSATVEYGEVPGPVSVCDPNTQGDLNGDGTVDFSDFLVLSNNFNMPATSHTEGDIDCNGSVAFADFLVLSTNFNKQVGGAAASVPEPGMSTMLLAAGGLLLAGRRRRKGKGGYRPSRNRSTAMENSLQKNLFGRLVLVALVALSVTLMSTSRATAQSTVTRGIDTYLTSAAKDGPDGSYGGETAFEWDGSDGGGFNQALLFFDIPQEFLEAFATGSNQEAILRLRNVDSGSPGIFHRMTVDWLAGPDGGDNVSFNNIPGGPGITPGENAEDVSNLNTGNLTSGVDYEFDVTVDVLAWANGEPNFGWGILPGGGGGNGIASFEDMGNPSPRLELRGLLLTNGDFNGDGVMDIVDFNILASNFYKQGTFADGDFDLSGRIDMLDFIGFRRAFHLPPAGAASVPEPSGISLIALGLLLLGRRRRQN